MRPTSSQCHKSRFVAGEEGGHTMAIRAGKKAWSLNVNILIGLVEADDGSQIHIGEQLPKRNRKTPSSSMVAKLCLKLPPDPTHPSSAGPSAGPSAGMLTLACPPGCGTWCRWRCGPGGCLEDSASAGRQNTHTPQGLTLRCPGLKGKQPQPLPA